VHDGSPGENKKRKKIGLARVFAVNSIVLVRCFLIKSLCLAGTRFSCQRCIPMNRSHTPRRKRSMLAVLARRLCAFYKSLVDDSAKDARQFFDRAMQQK
jgi:hypothetical protein